MRTISHNGNYHKILCLLIDLKLYQNVFHNFLITNILTLYKTFPSKINQGLPTQPRRGHIFYSLKMALAPVLSVSIPASNDIPVYISPTYHLLFRSSKSSRYFSFNTKFAFKKRIQNHCALHFSTLTPNRICTQYEFADFTYLTHNKLI